MAKDIIDEYNQMMLDDIDNNEDLYLEEPDKSEDEDDGEDNNFLNNDYTSDSDVEQIEVIPKQKIEVNTVNFSKDEDYTNQLNVGTLVELEHIHWWTEENPDIPNDIIEQIATNIAIDHLNQSSDYYTKLIRAGLVDEKDALDLYQSLYGSLPTQETKEIKKLPLPKMNNFKTRSAAEIGSDYRVEMKIEPTTKTATVQPNTVIEKQNDFTDYEKMINESGSGGAVDTGFNVNFDEIDFDTE